MSPATEATWTMAPPPCARIDRIAIALQWNVPMRCVWTTSSQAAGSNDSVRPTRWIPALLTRMSTLPSRASMSANDASTAAPIGHVHGEVADPCQRSGRRLDVGDDTAGALGDRTPDDVSADAARATRHDDDLIVESSGHAGPPVALPTHHVTYHRNRFR